MRTKDENKRVAIYHAAMDVVNENGVDNASMSKIAQAAGVSSSTIYVYFDNKVDMINKLYLMVKQESCLAMFNNLRETMGVEEATKSWMRNYFYYLIENPAKLSFMEQFYTSPTITEETRSKGLEYFLPIIDLYQRAVKDKIIKNHPLPLIRAFTFDPIMSLARTHLQKEHVVDDSILEAALEMSWISIKE